MKCRGGIQSRPFIVSTDVVEKQYNHPLFNSRPEGGEAAVRILSRRIVM